MHEKNVGKTFWGPYLRAPIPFKKYQNTSVWGIAECNYVLCMYKCMYAWKYVCIKFAQNGVVDFNYYLLW